MVTPKKIVWSYSNLAKFETCPRQWYSQYILKDIKFTPSPAVEWGKDVHNAMDRRIKSPKDVPLTGKFAKFEKYATSAKKLSGKLVSEYEMAVDADGKRVDWWDKNCFQRGKTDLSVFDPPRCTIMDWKTGKYRPNTEELEYFAYLTFMLHPEIDEIMTIYLWFQEDGPATKDIFIRERDYENMKIKFEEKVEVIEEALRDNFFPKKRSGLCQDYCGSPSCEYSGNYQGEPK